MQNEIVEKRRSAMNKKKFVISFALMAMLLTNVGCTLEQEENSSHDTDLQTKELSAYMREVQEQVYQSPMDKAEIIDSEHKLEEQENEQQDTASDESQVIYVEVEQEAPKEAYEVKQIFSTKVPSDILKNLKYDKYPINYDYLLLTGITVNIRREPTTESAILKNVPQYQRYTLHKEVIGQYSNLFQTDSWYKISWEEDDGIRYGYVISGLAQVRQFQFDKMYRELIKIKREIDGHQTAYIRNFRNAIGEAPLYNGTKNDKYGTRWFQSAPAYVRPDVESEFRYIEDGTLLKVVDKQEDFYKIRTLNFEGEYWVPKKYLSFNNTIKELSKIVIVDRKNQNQVAFEYEKDKWHMVSYTLATTGTRGYYQLETSLGYYMAIETVPRFLFLNHATKQIAGYAPYAVRFNGGTYIHGVPVSYKVTEDKRIDPGMQEYIASIGTIPLSSRCVRNYTSHAKFLYDWTEIGKMAIIVIE